MIVIPTYNGRDHLINLLTDIQEFDIPNDKVCIVDNKSTNIGHLEYIEDLKKSGYNVLYNTHATYELGAFKFAIDNGIIDDNYALFQDSIRLNTDVINYVFNKLDDNTVYTLANFEAYKYDSPNDRMYLAINYGTGNYSTGLLGSMFFINHNALQKVKDQWKLPRNKIDSMGTERALATIFDKNGINIIGLEKYDPALGGDYKNFTKLYGGRQ